MEKIMNKTTMTFRLTALSAALLAAQGQAVAADEETTRLTRPDSSLSIGIGALAGDRQQLGIYDGLDDDGAYLLLDADIRMRDEATGTWRTLEATNVGLESREIRGRIERQGDWGISLGYNQIPRSVPYTVNTGIQGVGTTTQVVSKPGIAPGSGRDLQMGTERDTVSLEFFKYLTAHLNARISFKNEQKDGTRHWGRGGQPEFAAEPIDAQTRQLEATLSYVGERLQVQGGYSGSWYDNANSLVDTLYQGDNPATLANHIYLSLPLDNQAHQVFVNGGYSFSPTTRASFKASYTHATQDEHLPTADIAGLALAAAPSHLDGEINTTLLQADFTARPLPQLNLLANLRYHNVDDDTPAHLVVSSGTTDVHSTPLSYETLSGKVEGVYRLPNGFNLIAGIDHSSQDRTVPVGTLDGSGHDTERYVPFRAELDETTYRIQLRRSLSETLNGAVALMYSERDGSEFAEAHHALGEINPINIADRAREKYRVTLDWTPNKDLGVQFNVEDAHDDYGDSALIYGVRSGTALLISVDADYAINDRWRVNAWFSHDDTTARQRNGRWDRVTEDHEADRTSHLQDIGNSFGLGVTGQVSPKFKVGGNLQWMRSRATYLDVITTDPTNPGADPAYPAGMSPLPEIKNTITRINLYGQYAIKKNADLRVDLIHERWSTDDWTWQFSTGSDFVYGSPNDGTTVITDPKQNATLLGVRYIHKFQ
jgi:MtrB/PioB family decaheme-associated outer membrane protein